MDPLIGGLTAGGLAAGGLGLMAYSYFRPLQVEGIPLLRYRLVGAPRPGSPLNDLRVPVSRFEAQIRHLSRRGFRAVGLQEALDRRDERAFLRTNPVVLSFDGPYASFAQTAWPILRRHGFERATLYFPPARLGQDSIVFNEGRPEPVLSMETLAGLAREGVDLGLQVSSSQQDDRAALADRFSAGRRALGDLSGQEVLSCALAFPTDESLSAANEAGFRAVALLGDGVLLRRSLARRVFVKTPDPLLVARFPVQPGTSLLEVGLVVGRRMGEAPW